MAVLEKYSRPKVWTREEAAKLSELFPDQRYELIEGELIDKMGQNPPHAYLVTLLNGILSEVFPRRVRVQSTIALPDPEGIRSEPEPDIVLLHKQSAEFFHRHPGPRDIALLIEVSDTSLQLDREIKGRLYARCGIELYWIVDLQRRRVIVLQNPGPEEYRSVTIYEAHEQLPAIDGLLIPVDSLFEMRS